jgi:fatty acid desaturase
MLPCGDVALHGIPGVSSIAWRQPGRRSGQMRLIPAHALRVFYAKSDLHGTARTLAHAALLAAGVVLIAAARGTWWLPAAMLVQGLFLVSLFAAMHECVHASAFRSRRLNEIVAWLAGLGILYSATYYRQFHFAHHRYAQDPTRDPELLTAPPPRSRGEYWWRVTAIPYWKARASNLVNLSRGRFDGLDFVPATAHPEIVRSVRALAIVLAVLALGSLALQTAALLWYWLLPLALGLPFLRLYLLSEHTGCSEDDDGLSNTRTTLSIWPVRFLMWNLPYHAEHHLYPSIPFHHLPATHRWLRSHLRHVAPGYVSVQRALYRTLPKRALAGVVVAVLVTLAVPPATAHTPGLTGLRQVAVVVEIEQPLEATSKAALGARLVAALRRSDPAIVVADGAADRVLFRVFVHPMSATALRGFWLPFSGTYGVGGVRLAVERVVTREDAPRAFPAVVWQTERVVAAPWRSTDEEIARLLDEMVAALLTARR